MTRRETAGERIAVRWCEQAYRKAAAKEIDRLLRKRMAEAWSQGWFACEIDRKFVSDNPYRGRKKK